MLRLLWMFFKTSLIADMEYRLNFVSRIFMDIVWYAGQIITFEVLYKHMPLIGGWEIKHLRVFLGVLFFIDAINMFLFDENLNRISEMSRKGELDLLLTKPINSQFLVSFRKLHTSSLINLLLAIIWLFWALQDFGALPWSHYILGLIVVPCSVAIFYAFRFCLTATSLLFTNAENLQFIWYSFYKLGTRPDVLYKPWLRYLLLTFIPVGVINSIPARLLMEKENIWLAPWSAVIALVLIYTSHKYWQFCLKHYASASS